MTQSFWEPEVAEETQPEIAVPATAMVVSADEFAALEERVLRAVQLVKQERQARIAAEALVAQAEARAAKAEADLRESEPLFDALHAEVKTLKAERDHVRDRVERLLQQLDALEL